MKHSYLWASVLLATVNGCSGCAESTTSHSGALELALRTGATCADGCALDRALVPGTEERIEVRATGDVDLGTLRVSSENPDIAAAWMERTQLCCSSATCVPVRSASSCEGAQLREGERMVVVRALAPGRARLAFRLGDEPLDAVDLEVAAPTAVSAERVLVDIGNLPIDVILPRPSLKLPPGLLGEEILGQLRTFGAPMPSTQGQLESLEIRAESMAVIRLEAHDAEGRTLHGFQGVTASIADPSVAVLVPPGLHGDGGVPSLTAELLFVRAVRTGRTELVLRAGEAETRIALSVDPSCAPAANVAMSGDACESDADCVPDACCHASACVHSTRAPACDDVSCTMECQYGTLDCGGRCLCLGGRCAGFRSPTPDPACPAPWRPEIPELPAPNLPPVIPVQTPQLPGLDDDDDDREVIIPPAVQLPGPRLPPGPRPTPD